MIQKGDLVLISSNGFPLDICTCFDVEIEGNKKDFWSVTFIRNIGSFSVPWVWKLDSKQLQGQGFSINNVPYELSIFLRTSVKEDKLEKADKGLDHLVKTGKLKEDNSMF